jgi:hypothetical protein
MDFTQAYDSVRREKKCMRHCNVPKFPIKLIRLVKETMDDTVAKVQVPNRCERVMV